MKLVIHAIPNCIATETAVHFHDFVSFFIVAIVAIHGIYNKTNIINESALIDENPSVFRSSPNICCPSGEFIFDTPYSTLHPETTSSFAAIPDISETAIRQYPSPIGASRGTMNFPKDEAKLSDMLSVRPEGPKFIINHIIIEAIKIVVPALLK